MIPEKIFKNTTFTWWQKVLWEIAMVSLGIILGATFWSFLSDLMPLWWLLFLIPGGYIIYIWWKKP